MEKTQTQSIFQFYKTILLGYIWIPYEFSYLRILDTHRSRRYQEKKKEKIPIITLAKLLLYEVSNQTYRTKRRQHFILNPRNHFYVTIVKNFISYQN